MRHGRLLGRPICPRIHSRSTLKWKSNNAILLDGSLLGLQEQIFSMRQGEHQLLQRGLDLIPFHGVLIQWMELEVIGQLIIYFGSVTLLNFKF